MHRYQNPKYLAKSRKSKQMKMALISMICSIALCVTCFIGTTWAWFETSYQMGSSTIRIATFAVAVSMEKGDQALDGEETERDNLVATDQYTYLLEEIGTYTVNLVNNGEIPGYCTIQLKAATGETMEYTTGMLYPFGEGDTDSAIVELEVTPQDSYGGALPIELKIIPSWGQDPNQEVADIHDSVFVPETTGTTESTEPEEELQSGAAGATTPTTSTEPVPTQPTTKEPVTTEPVKKEPETTEPVTTEPVNTEPITTEPETTEPEATEPVTTEPVTTEPVTTEPLTTEPTTKEPEATEPVTTEPLTTEPTTKEPEATEPVTTESEVTEPVTTEPEVTEPATTEPVTTEPTVTEPEQKSRIVETEPTVATESPTETTVVTE